MNIKRSSFAIILLMLFSNFAWAEAQEAHGAPSFVENLIVSVLPFIIIALLIWFFFIRSVRNLQTSQVQEQRQHRENLEKLLERIAKALERKGGDGA